MNFLVRREAVDTIDDWFTLGLCATGSRSLSASELFVPEHRAVLYDALLTGRTPGAAVHPQYGLCRTPRQFLTAFSISPVIAGLADRALRLALENAEKSLRSPAGIRDIGALQLKIAESSVENGTVQMIMATRLEEARDRIGAGEQLGERDVAANRLYASHMVRTAMGVIERLCTTLGSRWVYQGDPFQLILRDAMTGATHRGFTWDIAAHAYAASIGLVAP